ncbi:MAG: sugar phosphate isomerase/epimerase [Clostridia bacterium]|nr:sugar phosphate isomerase/epimerase [Clostridia bacterium]
MASIQRSQLTAMNQHYRRFSLDYFLDCQERLGIQSLELWCGASHFFLDHERFDDVSLFRKKLRDRRLRVVSVTAPSIAYQYQYASQEPGHLEYSFRYFSNAIRLAAQLGADRVVVNSGWGYRDEDENAMWNRCRDHMGRLCGVAEREGIFLVMESLRADETNLVYSLERAGRMYREIAHPSLKMMVDSIATGAAGETLEDWFDAFGPELVHMHFLDGDPWLHNIWGDGNTALERQLQTINDRGYTGYLVQEVADEHYFADPYAADQKNLRVLERFLTE